MKKCKVCFKMYPLDDFKKHKETKDGHVNICRLCCNAAQREHRKNNKNEDMHKYEKTKQGFLMRVYRNMQSRVEGVQKKKAHLYKGLPLIDRDVFYMWAVSDEFHRLFKEWEDSGYDRKLTPTVDRIDSSRGYAKKNMEWVTHSENSRRGALSRHHKQKVYQ